MNEPAAAEAASEGSDAWGSNPRTLMLVGAVAFALLGLLALASAIDLPTRESVSDSDARIDQAAERVPGRVDIGPGGEVDIRPIPGCPGGFSIGEDIYVVPDPEACGFRPVQPGERGLEDSGKIILVPSPDGNIGGMRIGPDGQIELLPPGLVGPNDFTIGRSPDGSFGLIRPDGSRVDIVPGDDGLSLRDPSRGNSEFLPGQGNNGLGDQNGENGFGDENGENSQNSQGAQDEPFTAPPPSLAEPDQEQSSSSDDDTPTDWSGLGLILLVIVGLGFLGFLIYALTNNDWRKSNDRVLDETVGLQDSPVDYAAEISALDRLLWEIDQEPDPRLAIQRVYAALETGLENPAMARRYSETPGIYLRRVLGHFTELEVPLQELTNLFEQARFSEHEITGAMRDRAINALVAVRGHYAHAAATAAAAAPDPALNSV